MKNLKVALLQLMPEDTLDGDMQKRIKILQKIEENRGRHCIVSYINYFMKSVQY